MLIEPLIAGIPAELRTSLERAAELVEGMTGGRHLQDWLEFEVSLWGVRTEAMRAAFTNQPKGRGYNEAHSQLMAHYGLDKLDKHSVSAVLWLTDPQNKHGPDYLTRRQILDLILVKMNPAERSGLGSPITARQKVEKKIAELAKSDTNEGEPNTGQKLSKLKQTEQILAKALQEKQHLEEQLKRKDDGSLFDLRNDTAEDIATQIVLHLTPSKAETIAKGVLARVKRKQRTPAG